MPRGGGKIIREDQGGLEGEVVETLRLGGSKLGACARI